MKSGHAALTGKLERLTSEQLSVQIGLKQFYEGCGGGRQHASASCCQIEPRLLKRGVHQRHSYHIAGWNRCPPGLPELKADAAIHTDKSLHGLHGIGNKPRLEFERGASQRLFD